MRFSITLDFHESESAEHILISALDADKTLRIRFADGVRPYHITEDCNVRFAAVMQDRTAVVPTCEVVSNEVRIPVSILADLPDGIAVCELEITSGAMRLTSPKFRAVVDHSANEELVI